MNLEMENGLPTSNAINGLMPEGRSGYALVLEHLTKSAFERKINAYDVVCEVTDANDSGNLQPPLTDLLATAAATFKAAGAEATSQSYLRAEALLHAIFQHGHRKDSV